MDVLIQVWSDNHGHDETFGTQPNKHHYVYDDTVQVESGSNLLAVIAESIRNTGCSAKSGTCIAVCGMELLRETA